MAPDLASLKTWPVIGFHGRVRRVYWLATVVLVPVAHDAAGLSRYGSSPVGKDRVIESPVDAIDDG